jgi:NTE family protein
MISAACRAAIVLISLAAVVLASVARAQEEPAQKESPPPSPQARAALQDAASEPASEQRPRIGLALSGGGARGLAHIGVLQWMEENRIPVDAVAGTSMGGIVGAMYATGMSPAEMRQFVETVDWDEALLNEPSYDQLSYRRKQDRRDFQAGAELGLRHGLSGPNGFNPRHGIGLLADRIAFPYSTLASFDDLPIPFRCVATDMLEGKPVVLKDGPLAQAIQATGAIPGVFTPVELNGKVLADGGLVENIPTGVARLMNADIVIAVDIGTPLGGREQLQTLSGVLEQTVDVMTIDNDRRSLREADIVIAPDLGSYTRSDYYSAEQIIRLGYQGAARKAAVLRPFALSDADWQQYLAQRKSRKRVAQKSVDVLEVTGVTGDLQRRLASRLQKTVQGPVDLDKLDQRLTRIAGEGQFDRLGYEGFMQNGVPGLHVTAHEKTYGPPFVDFAVNVDGSGVAAFDFSAGARVTFMDVGHHGGEWRNDLLLGSSNLAATEFYQPLGTSHIFAAPYAFASKSARNAFTGQTRVAVFGDERAGGGFDLGYDSGRRSEFRFGYEIFEGKLDPLVGSAGLPVVKGSTGELHARYVWDGQDSPAVPSRGLRLIANLSRVFQSPGLLHPIDQLDVQTSTFVPSGSKTSVFFTASGGTTFRGAAGPLQIFALGGPFRLGAYLPQEFLGNHYAYSSLGFRRELGRLPQLVGKKIYWGGWYEAGSAWGGSISPGTTVSDSNAVVVRGTINLGVIAETFIGPVALAGSVSPTGQSRLNFSIGRLF